ncbi:MAG TPA: adenine deaminase [Chitinophagaceae bacterium]|jgi:adenine deaminase|nr:adenine deaminase [Chitinophagaceae bacterium]
MIIQGKLVDIPAKRIYPAEVTIRDKKIHSIREMTAAEPVPDIYICPGFIDAHVHIESSMLVPSEFARLAVVHGTVATVSDPHEIANVLGTAGVEFMIENGRQTPFHFYFGAPSCVPATPFETAGAVLPAGEVDLLLSRPEIKYLSEMMNFPGVLQGDPEVMEKIASAKKYEKPVDGHAPGLRGEDARKYINAGISTDHECVTADEALDKLQMGMKILIREGSAARNFEALAGLLTDYWEQIMFCSDDKHPDSLVNSHINQLCARALAKNIDVFKILQAACINPITHYRLEVGRLRPGDAADFILLKDLKNFDVLQTYLQGQLAASDGKTRLKPIGNLYAPNQFHCDFTSPGDFQFKAAPYDESPYPFPVIEALDGQLITGKYQTGIPAENGFWVADPARDILKIIVLNRYKKAPPAMGFIKNFGLKSGALASSVAHDSHNIVAVGVSDEALSRTVNAVIAEKGGISLAYGGLVMTLGLPIGGLMSAEEGYKVAETYTAMDKEAKKMGSLLGSPFMTLSFMALLVIPHLKLSDLGLFDGDRFQMI